MYCKFLSKALNGKIKCSKNKTYISYPFDCKNCLERNLTQNKGIKKVSSKHISVKKEIYKKVIERDNYTCQLKDLNCNGGLELHHIIYRSENKLLINEPTNCIMLCCYHHNLVHSNKHLWQPKLKEIIERK